MVVAVLQPIVSFVRLLPCMVVHLFHWRRSCADAITS
jgi:hypothetical protein